MPQEPCSILAGTLGFPEPRDKPSDASKEASDRTLHHILQLFPKTELLRSFR
jgi:hypothetical protein